MSRLEKLRSLVAEEWLFLSHESAVDHCIGHLPFPSKYLPRITDCAVYEQPDSAFLTKTLVRGRGKEGRAGNSPFYHDNFFGFSV
jgi:hypothetical protein